MSRRKQANPRPLKYEDGDGPEGEEKYQEQQQQQLAEKDKDEEEEEEEEEGEEGESNQAVNNEDGDDDDDDDVDDFPPPLVIDAPEVCEDSHSEYGSLRNSDEKDSVTSGDSSTKRSSTNGSPSKKSRKEDKILPIEDEDGQKFVCPVCKEEFNTPEAFTIHIRSHNSPTSTKTHSCIICGKILSSQSSLDRHMLVHSGFRPFKCKICKMTFTTNGNMHRHSRIHEKEGTPKSSPPASDKEKENTPSEHSKSSKQTDSESSDTPVRTAVVKRRRRNKSDGEVLAKRKEPEEYETNIRVLITPGRKRPPAPAPRRRTRQGSKRTSPGGGGEGETSKPSPPKRKASNADTDSMSSTPTMLGLFDISKGPIVSPSKRQLERLVSALEESTSKFKADPQESYEPQDPEKLHCPVCNKTFLCKYGLESHLETHPNSAIRCQACHLSFRNPRGLEMHKRMVHYRRKNNQDAPIDRHNGFKTNIPVGFHDLGFVDFSTVKFPLIAKAWCEKNTRRSSSVFHDFSCSSCRKSFPCGSALKLHNNSHSSDHKSHCEECECDYASNAAFALHYQKHERIAKLAAQKASADDHQGDIEHSGEDEAAAAAPAGQKDFLAMFDLRKADEESNIEKENSVLRKSAKLTNDYYAKLTTIDISKVTTNLENLISDENDIPNREPQEDHSSDSDFADIQTILKNTTGAPKLTSLSNAVAMPTISTNPKDVSSDSSEKVALDLTAAAESQEKGDATVEEAAHSSDEGVSPPASPSANGLPVSTTTPEATPSTKSMNGFRPIMPKPDGKEFLHCKYCDKAYTNFRMLKAHVRSHLGLTPYKCNQCPYSSADKSTLIRHLRTHNGERPFQCKICEYAFTTKANCERHVRKKHHKSTKSEIEESVGYNKLLSESPRQGLKASDTVCKYCGVDFKFFRSLKHHLRSYHSCSQKPFICQVCHIGFSTKANCIRHIQKQHDQVPADDLEANIKVNELYIGQDGMAVSKSMDTVSLSQPAVAMSTVAMSTVANAKSTVALVPVTLSVSSLPSMITAPPLVVIKQEPQELCEPLDFSLKGRGDPAKVESRLASIEYATTEDQPIDLTIHNRKAVSMNGTEKKQGPTVAGGAPSVSSTQLAPQFSPAPPLPSVEATCPPTSPSPSPPPSPPRPTLTPTHLGMLRYKKDYQQYYNPTLGRLQCPYCCMTFKHGLKLQVHIRSHTNERPYRCTQCSAGFTIKTNLDRHLKTRHQQQQQQPQPQQPKVSQTEQTYPQASSLSNVFAKRACKHDLKPPIMISNIQCIPLRPLSPDSDTEVNNNNNNNNNHNSNINNDNINNNSYQPKLDENSNHSKPDPVKSSTIGTKRSLLDNKSPASSFGSDISGELASVTKLLDAAKNYKAIFPPAMDENSNDISMTMTSNAHDSGQSEALGEGYVDADGKRKRNSYSDSPHKLLCPFCPRMFPWISSLKRHILTHTGQKPFKCPQCPVTFSTKSNRERHMLRKHGLHPSDPAVRAMTDRPYKCHMCAFSSFTTAGNLIKHYQEEHPGCIEMPDLYSNSSAEDDNADDTESCDRSKQGTPAPEDIDDAENCTPNGETGSNPASKADVPSSDPGLNPERDNYNVDRITECWKCGEDYADRKMLLRHLKDHNIDLPYKCYLCDASFDTRRDSLEHKVAAHWSEWVMLKVKNKISELDKFISVMEELVERGCREAKMKAKGEELPMIDGTEQEDSPHNPADYVQRKVYCSLCTKRFWSLQDLRRHMRSHTGERPFECDVCQKRFTLKHSMMRHKRKHGGEHAGHAPLSDEEETNSITAESVESSRTGSSMTSDLPSGSKPVRPSDSQRSSPSWNGDPVLAASSDMYLAQQDCANSPKITTELALSDSIDQSDILENLLGVENETIDQMLSSATTAAKFLGMD